MHKGAWFMHCSCAVGFLCTFDLFHVGVMANVPRTRILSLARALHSGRVASAGQQWRLSRGKARSGTEYGPLTDTPDWCFADGRPAPPTKAYVRRAQRQRKIGERIQRLISEMEKAEETA